MWILGRGCASACEHCCVWKSQKFQSLTISGMVVRIIMVMMVVTMMVMAMVMMATHWKLLSSWRTLITDSSCWNSLHITTIILIAIDFIICVVIIIIVIIHIFTITISLYRNHNTAYHNRSQHTQITNHIKVERKQLSSHTRVTSRKSQKHRAWQGRKGWVAR